MTTPLLMLENVGVRQQSEWLFEHVDLYVAPRDRLALVGRNGAGKSTLMRLLAGTREADRGGRRLMPGASVVHLEQEPPVGRYPSLRDYALSPVLNEGVVTLAGAEPHMVAALADELRLDLDTPSASASGGEARRAALVRALALNPAVLLLDEPTNHLDIEAIAWLEERLLRQTNAQLIISHDRAFLTKLTRSTLWLDQGVLRRKEIGFGGFEQWQDDIYAEAERNTARLESKLRLELHWLQRGVTGRRRRNQGRLAKLESLRSQRRTVAAAAGTAKLALASDGQQSKLVISVEQASKSYDDRAILKPFSLRILRGDRIGIIGANGAGKTTLLRVLTGDLPPDSGRVHIAKSTTMVTIDQQRALLRPGQTLREILTNGADWIDVRGERKHIATYLKEFLFDPKLVEADVATLSGGERARLLLAREFAKASSLLVLDEPTNDLDLETLDLLQEVMADYEGTILLVSHDRDFLDRTVNLVIGLDGSGSLDIVAGGYADWQAKRTTPRLPPVKKPIARVQELPTEPTTPVARLSYKDQRDLDLLPGQIAKVETAIRALEQALADPALYSRNPERFASLSADLTTLKTDLTSKEERWLALAEMAEMTS